MEEEPLSTLLVRQIPLPSLATLLLVAKGMEHSRQWGEGGQSPTQGARMECKLSQVSNGVLTYQ